MHEVSIAVAVCEEVTQRASSEKAKRIVSVRLRAGELTCIVSEALRFAWDVVTEGTIAAGSRLEIERIPVQIRCRTCESVQAPVGATALVCVRCGTPAAEIVRGRELEVTAMEIVDDTADSRRSAIHT
jgi:hydrogenase nickel incorporation protein HypA/HybF